MDIPQTADIIIVGGGVIGVSLAFHLTQRQAGKVVLLERKYLAAGATGKSSGLVRTHYDNPIEAQFAIKSLPIFHHFAEIVGGDCGFTRTGFVRTVQPHNLPQLKANVAMLQALGAQTELIDGATLRTMADYLRTDDITLAAYEPQSGYADPYLTTMGLAQAARRRGAQIIQGVEVTGIDVAGGQIRGVRTPEGAIAAPVVVNAAGPWGALVAAQAGVRIDLEVIYHQVAAVETPPSIPTPHLTLIDRLNYIYVRPETGGLTLFGGSASGENEVLRPSQLDSYSDSIRPGLRNRLLERLCNRIAVMETAHVRKGHAGVYGRSRDGHALLGPTPGIEGFYQAVGFSGHGFKEAPTIGQALAELILYGKAEVVDITPLRVTRFAEGRSYQGEHSYQ